MAHCENCKNYYNFSKCEECEKGSNYEYINEEGEKVSNVIKRPSHYVDGRKYEPKDVIRDWGLNFNLGSSVKYIARAGRKDDIVQDLKKAQEFIQFEIDAIEKERIEKCVIDGKID